MENNEKIGGLLKSAREKKKISLEDVANKTKININILKALESDDISSLPNKTYVKGFVKNYAKTISLDSNQALEALENTYGTKEPETISEKVENLETYEEKEAKVELEEIQESVRSIVTSFFNKKIFISIAVVIVLYIVGKGVTSFFMTLSQEQKSITSADAEVKELKEDDGTIKSQDKSLFDLESSKKLAEAEEPKAEAMLAEKKEEVKNLEPEKLEKAAVVKPAEKRVAKEEKEDKEEEKEEVVENKKEEKVNLPRGKFPFVKFYPAPRELFSVVEDAPENTDDTIFPNALEMPWKKISKTFISMPPKVILG
jgi:cytoskeletal protein RodZ